ncbi:Uncharacterised protein [uncultured archaeon]|nr:Uncharacterised protein [uncultured archaeon]
MIFEHFWEAIGRTNFSRKGYSWFRDLLIKARILTHNHRQEFHIGWLKKNISKEDFRSFLKKKGYEESFYSWIDKDEILGMRKIDSKIYQYHIRLFKDGEVRGHYEYAPDRYPLRHYFSSRFEERRKYFLELLKGKLSEIL